MLFTLLSFLAFSCLVGAAPTISPVEFLAFAPTIIEPTNQTVWKTNSVQLVKWETDNVPVDAAAYTVNIYLGYLTTASENLGLGSPLASKIPIMQGNATVKVPSNLTTRNDYIVAVVGDSGDISQPFIITST